jgi:hypothetical protein
MIQVVCQWPTPVILVTQKAEIRRISVQSQPEQIVPEKNSSQKKKKKSQEKGWWSGSNGRLLAQQALGSEFKPQCQGEKKKKKK